MEGAEALFTLAEVSVALAASTGIILALTKDPATWRPFDSVRVYLLLAASLGVTILSLLPMGLQLAGLGGPTVWRICSIALALYIVAFLAVALRRMLGLPPQDRVDFRPVFFVAFNGMNLLVVVAQALNALGILLQGTVGPYFFGLLWLVTWSAILFMLLIFLRPMPDG